jgi:hypothetical protein
MCKMSRLEAKDWAKGGKCNHGHVCCKVHEVTRDCGHTDRLHYSDLCRFWDRRTMHQATQCGECAGMADQGIVILDNHFQLAVA